MPAPKIKVPRSRNHIWFFCVGVISSIVVSQFRGEPPQSIGVADVRLVPSPGVADICRATIAALMGRQVSIIKTDSLHGDIAYVGYVRPSDGTVWKYRCRVGNGTVIWASSTGRWRDNREWDEIITYAVTDGAVAISIGYPYEAGRSTKRFPLAELMEVR